MAKKQQKPSDDPKPAADTQNPNGGESPQAPAQSGELIDALRISAKADQFHRCGRRFGRSERVIATADFDADEIARLHAEPMLVVVEATVEPAELTA